MDLKDLQKNDEYLRIFPGAVVVGDVTFGPDCSVWYNAVVRGDCSPIRIGRGCNIQDNAVLHGDVGVPTILGDGVTVGHGAIIHSSEIGDNTLIGMGAIVLSRARIGKNCIVGAGALVTGKTVIPDGYLAMGSPAKAVRPLTPQEIAANKNAAKKYIELKEQYAK